MTRKPPRRVTSEEERKLFHAVLKGAKPLRRLKTAALTAPAKTAPTKSKPTEKTASQQRSLHPEGEAVSAIGGHVAARLRRGRVEPGAILDLHGLGEAEAHRALGRFFIRAHSADERLVLIITGKGGILQANVPRWLAENPFRGIVAGVSSAHNRHGGAGALYVALRRKKHAP